MAPGLPQTCPDFLSSFPIKTLTFCQPGIKRAHKWFKCHFMALSDTQAAQAPAGNICTQITLKICFPIFTPQRGLNGGQMSGIRFFFFFSSWLCWVSVRKERDVSTWQGGTEALARRRESSRSWGPVSTRQRKEAASVKMPFPCLQLQLPPAMKLPFPPEMQTQRAAQFVVESSEIAQ